MNRPAPVLSPLRRRAVATVRRLRRLKSRKVAIGRHGLILMYHRIATPAADPWDLSVSPAHFAEHLEVLRRMGRTMTFADAAASLAAPSGPHRVVSVTFDDGYRDNLLAATPILEAQDVPATVFVTTGSTDSGRAFWWDALAHVFIALPALPRELVLAVDGRAHRWDLGAAATCGPAELRALAAWRDGMDHERHVRTRVLMDVWRLLIARPRAEADDLADQVLAWAGADQSLLADAHPMSAAELARLASSPLIEIGGHTRSHPSLNTLPPAAAAEEIAGSHADLTAMLGRPPATFAYPFGRFNDETPGLVAAAGFSAACTCMDLVAWRNCDIYQVSRITVRDWDGDTFARMMRQCAGA